MKKIKVIFPDGSTAEVSESELPQAIKAGARVAEGNNEKKTSVKFPDGSEAEVGKDDLDAALSAGAVKKKEAGAFQDFGNAGGAAVAPSPTPSPSKEKNNLAQPNIAIGAGSAFDESGGVDTVLGRPSVYEIVSEDEKVVEKTKPIQAPIETAGKLPDRYQKAKDAALKEVGINKEEFDAASKNSFDIKKDVILSYQGTDFKIKPNRVPEGYSKDIEGARKYAIDLNTILRNPSTDDATKSLKIKELLKVSNLGRLDENKEILSPKDFEYINKITGKNYTSVSAEMIADLDEYSKNKKDNLKHGVIPYASLEGPIKNIKNKISNSIQEEVQGAGSINTLSGDTRSDLQATIKGIDVENIVGRMGQENMTNLFATGLESLKYSNPAQYDILKRRLAEGKTIASAKVAELTNIGAKIIDLRELEKLGRDETTIDQYYTKNNEVGEQLSENFYNRPDIVQKSVSDVIARHYEKDGTALFGKWMVSDKEIDNVPASEFEAAGIDINRPEVKAAINNIKKNEGLLPFDNAIQKDALVRELGRGFMQPLKGTASFIGNIGTSDDEKRLQKELEPINNYVSQRSEYFNKRYGGIADAFNGAGQFVSQLMLMEGAIGLFKGVGLAAGGSELMTFVRTPESAIPTAIRQGSSIGNKLIDKSNLFGRVTVPYMQSYDSYHKSALEKTDNPLAAKVYAFVNASMETLSEQMFDNVKFGRQVVADFSNKGFNINKISKILSRGEFDQTALDEIKLLTKNGLKESIEAVYKGSKDLVKESLEEIPVSFTNFVSDALLDPKSVEGRELLPELKDAFLSGLVSFSIPSIIGTSGRLKKIFTDKTTQQDALMIAARNRGDVIDAIYNQLEDGEIEGDEANTRIKVLNTAAAALAQMPKSKSDGTPMSEANNSEYLALTVQGKILEEQNKQIDDESVRTINEEKIKEINAKKVEILKSKDPDENEAPISSKTFTDFDNTLFKDGKLTPLGEDIKARVAAGEDISILTAREATPENIQFIKDQIGVDEKDIVAGLTPEGKAGFLTPGSTFYDDNEDNLAAARKIAGVNVVDSKAPETTLFDRVQESGNDGIKQLYSTPESITELQDQALTTPSNINEKLGGNEELTTDLIAQNGEQKINAAIQALVEKQKNPDTTDQETEEIDSHINLLEKGLAKTVQAAPAIAENQPKLPTVSETEGAGSSGVEGKSDVEKQKQLEDKVEEINKKRQSLRGEDGTVPADKMNEWNQLGKELNEAKVSAQRGNSSGSILIKKFEDGADKATSDPVILSEKEKSEASDIIEQVIQGSKTVEEAVKKIARLGYIFDVANANLLTKYISDRLNPDAPKVGNNKSSFQDWVNGKQPEGKSDVVVDKASNVGVVEGSGGVGGENKFKGWYDRLNEIRNGSRDEKAAIAAKKLATEIFEDKQFLLSLPSDKRTVDGIYSLMSGRGELIDALNSEAKAVEQSLKAEDKAPVTKPEGKSDVVVDKASNVGGDKKEIWMQNIDSYIESELPNTKGSNEIPARRILSDRYEGELGKAIEEGKFQKAIAEGKMSATDAINIIKAAKHEVPKDIQDGIEKVPMSDNELQQIVGRDVFKQIQRSEEQLGEGVVDRNRMIETAKRIQKADKKDKLLPEHIFEALQYETGYPDNWQDLRNAIKKGGIDINSEAIQRQIEVGVDLPKDIVEEFKKSERYKKATPELVKAVEQSLSKQESGGKAPVTKSEGAKVVMPGENVKPNIVELKKEEKYGKYETLARKAAENIMKAELPSWAKADLPDGTKLSGTNFDQIKKLIADATIKLGKLMDTGSEYAEAIKEAVKELVDYLGENRREDIEKGVTDAYLENGGELPKLKARITADQAEKLDAQSKKEKSQSDAYEAAGEFEFGRMPFEPTDNPIINHKLKTNGVQQAFGTELTQQELWNDMPSEEKYDVQIKMLDDGNEMIGLAKMMFGGTDINVYGPELFRFIQNMPDTPDNKKVILTASFIGELRNELDRSKSGSIRPLYNAVNLYYRNYMHVTAKRLAAGRILRLFTDKYMAGIFGDVILEADQVKEKKDIENAIADTDITDQDAASFQEAKSKGKTKEQAKKESDVDKKNNESKRSESAKRKATNKKNYEDLAKKKEADIKAKYGDKKSLLNDIIKKINDLNCP